MKHERLICAWTSIDVEVYLGIVKVLFRDQEADISDVLEVSLWYFKFCDWFYIQPIELIYEYGYWKKCRSMLDQLWWLISIDINPDCNYFQAASKKYK